MNLPHAEEKLLLAAVQMHSPWWITLTALSIYLLLTRILLPGFITEWHCIVRAKKKTLLSISSPLNPLLPKCCCYNVQQTVT